MYILFHIEATANHLRSDPKRKIDLTSPKNSESNMELRERLSMTSSKQNLDLS